MGKEVPSRPESSELLLIEIHLSLLPPGPPFRSRESHWYRQGDWSDKVSPPVV